MRGISNFLTGALLGGLVAGLIAGATTSGAQSVDAYPSGCCCCCPCCVKGPMVPLGVDPMPPSPKLPEDRR